MMMKEQEILAAGIKLLLPHCRWLARINGGSRGRGGKNFFRSYLLYRPEVTGEAKDMRLPDVIGQLRDGRQIAIEFKKPGEKPTEKQALFLEIAHGIKGVCYNSDDVQSLINTLLRG